MLFSLNNPLAAAARKRTAMYGYHIFGIYWRANNVANTVCVSDDTSDRFFLPGDQPTGSRQCVMAFSMVSLFFSSIPRLQTVSGWAIFKRYSIISQQTYNQYFLLCRSSSFRHGSFWFQNNPAEQFAGKADSKGNVSTLAVSFSWHLRWLSFLSVAPGLFLAPCSLAPLSGGAWRKPNGLAGFNRRHFLRCLPSFHHWLQSLPKSGGWLDTVKNSLLY